MGEKEKVVGQHRHHRRTPTHERHEIRKRARRAENAIRSLAHRTSCVP